MKIHIKPYNNDYFSLSFDGSFNNEMLNAVRNVNNKISL